jgi:hypothetical protein
MIVNDSKLSDLSRKLLLISALILVFVFAVGILSFSEIETGETQSVVSENIKEELRPDQALKTGTELCYGVSRRDGFLVAIDAGKTWAAKNEGLPTKLVYPVTEPTVRTITGFGIDPVNPERVAVTMSSTLFLSEDSGEHWQTIPFVSKAGNKIYFTAVALSPFDKNTMVAGTSFAGIFETKDRGQTWSNISEKLRFLYQGVGFWEEISAVTFVPEDPGTLLFSCGFGNGLYLFNKDRNNAIPVDLSAIHLNSPGVTRNNGLGDAITGEDPKINYDLIYTNLSFIKTSDNHSDKPWLLEIGTMNGSRLCSFDTSDQLVPVGTIDISLKKYRPDQAKIERLRLASGKFGIYLRSDNARGKQYDQHLQFLTKYGFNALVVDCKDDSGFITYNTRVAPAHQAGAVKPFIQMESFLKKAKENGLYVIGRVVVFQDPKLYRFQKYKYAVWNRLTNTPWGTKEFWVDPYCPEVWEYNLAIAGELQTLGVDEIQFDYIRFPTDGDIANITYRYRPNGMEKIDALESFLAKARERLAIPISTDLYGYNCWCRVDSINGQNLDMITNYVDVICPMFYPSHFTKGFMSGVEYLERAKRIYSDGTKRAYVIAGKRTLIRPYVQAFLLGGETKMAPVTYTKYLQNQIEGVMDSPSPGFTLWNYGNKYFMVTKPLVQIAN